MKCSVVEESSVQWNTVNCSSIDISASWCSDVLLRTTTFSALGQLHFLFCSVPGRPGNRHKKLMDDITSWCVALSNLQVTGFSVATIVFTLFFIILIDNLY